MEPNDPTLVMAGKIGELTGVISGLSGKIDGLKVDMKEKIGRDTCENIVNEAIDNHRRDDHKKNSSAPSSKNTVISIPPGAWKILLRIVVILGSAGIGGLSIWTIIKQIFGI